MSPETLPPQYLAQMRGLLQGEYPAYLQSLDAPRSCGLRVNTSKISPEDFRRKSGLTLEKIPWIPNGFYCLEQEQPAKSPYYYAGLFYLQEPSAMTPAALLSVNPGDWVLDLCAAPGGKSTQLGVGLEGKGLLVSNDISSSRAKALLKNLEIWGIPNICVTSESPERLEEAFGPVFDKIMVDAPCSGEGMFRRDPSIVKSYEERGPEFYVPLQREILSSACRLLRPGGYLLYSTCTFSILEDEENVSWLLQSRQDMELVPLPGFEGSCGGFGLPGCLRLFPHKIRGEGHFMALLRKREDGPRPRLPQPPPFQPVEIPAAAGEFLKLLRKDIDVTRLHIKNNRLFLLPEGFEPVSRLRFLRTGLLLGELKNGRFEPSQALAMSLKAEEFQSVAGFSPEDGRVLRYLKGETLSLQEGEASANGWRLVCVDGYPLGFAKGAGRTLKNKYYPGWRWR